MIRTASKRPLRKWREYRQSSGPTLADGERFSEFIPHHPTERQQAFLELDCIEGLFGGAAGGGKSDALLMAALRNVHVPGYSAILFRRTFADLALPGALIPRSHQWLGGTTARYSDNRKTWSFPSGATLSFGYLDKPLDKYRYQSSEFQFIGFDELTQFRRDDYTYLFSRLRKVIGINVPLLVRGATNPGGFGHLWVKERFQLGRTYASTRHSCPRKFIASKLDDNPHLDRDEYLKSLAELDPITRMQLLGGDWDASSDGSKFKRDWFRYCDAGEVPRGIRKVRYWDIAATEPSKPGDDPDWTVGALVGLHEGRYYILDIRRFRRSPAETEKAIAETARSDGYNVPIWMEQEGGSGGKNTISYYSRHVLQGYTFCGDRPTGSKEIRANPVSSAAQNGNVALVRAAWNANYVDELCSFPGGEHDDQVDATSGGVKILRGNGGEVVTW